MQLLFAGSPLALILVVMLGLGRSAAVAGMAGLALALAVSIWVFDLGTATLADIGVAPAVGASLVEAAFTAATILWIIFPALCIYVLQDRHGAFGVIRDALFAVSADRRFLVLLIGWFFSLFVEGAAGFGASVALAAPLLVTIGYTPLKAVVLALIGHAAGVSFGAVGTPVITQAAVTGMDGGAIATQASLMHLTLGWMLVVALLWMSGERRPTLRDIGWALLAALCFLAPAAAIAWAVGPELPTLGGSLIGLGVFVWILKRAQQREATRTTASDREPGPELRVIFHAVLPYAVLLALILLTRLIGPVQEALRVVEWSWTLPGPFAGSFQPLYHPGTMLMGGFLIGALLQGRNAGDIGAAMSAALARLAKVTVALLAMLALSRIMVHGGMITELAEGAAQIGTGWPLLAPAVGALGTFVTGSATASNILFSEFQVATAQSLGLPAITMLAAQTFGAAIGNIACPHNIIAGGATVGLQGEEGHALRATLPVCLIYAAAGGLLVLAVVAAAGPV
ncbi:L-lactate permease [Fodinicurvata sp. EGI_FJ10296]|uniref:L-lactate permease n=1 Tax=Fodinicurvata sp. EGI_FJ10296 TaxID=3231908 RepID=UPI003452E48C